MSLSNLLILHDLFDSINPILTVLAILITYTFIILIISRASHTKANYLFILTCLSVMLWNLGTFLFRVSGNQAWSYLAYLGSASIPVCFFLFILALIKREMKGLVFASYFSCAFLSFIPLLSLVNPGFEPYVNGMAWDILYFFLIAPFFLLGVVTLFFNIKRSNDQNEKSQLRFVFVAGVVGIIAASSDHVQRFNLPVPIPVLGHLGSALAPSLLAVAVFRHKSTYDVLTQIKLKLALLNQISSGIAHEICNPLSSIKGASCLLHKRLEKNEEVECFEYVNIIGEEADRLDKIIHDFISYSRPMRLEKEPTSVNDIIRKTVKLMEAEDSGIFIKLDMGNNLNLISADPSALKQVLLNIIKNSIEVCSPGKELIIKTENVHPFVRISISDNGPGIAPELLEQIFEPFFTTKKNGMGMGLHICQQIITAHEGRIEIENLAPSGAKFTIYLPA
jgi:signal transduction histidine kinase